MAYASPMKIANGLVLDFTVDNADTAADTFLGLNASGEVTKFASVPRARVSGGGNITEATSSVLSITGGTAAVLTSGLTIQVLQAGAAQSGYLSTTDWNTFNNKLSGTLTSANIYVGNGSNVATGVAMSGDISITNTGNTQIVAGAIVNADINASAAIAVSKLEALTASRVLGSNGSGVIQALDTATYPSLTELSYVKSVTSAIQTQLNNRLSVTLSSPTNGDVITYNGAAWVNSPSSTGVPTAGTTAQILRKIDNTNYNTEWHTLVAADITDVSSTAAELNKLSGVTTTATQFNFLNTLSGDVQAQLAAKLSTSLTQNYMFIGDASNVVSTLAPGTNGYVLTSVSGVPTWVSPGVGGTVTSVAASGGTTGMSFTGSPITTTGTLTLTGTLAIANGGTGLTALGTALQLQRVNAGATALEYFTPNLTQFVSQTNWRTFYSNGSGDVTELAFGAYGTALKSNSTTSAPAFDYINPVVTRSFTANNYTVQDIDNGCIVELDNGATAGTITLPTGLPASWSCNIINKGTGILTLTLSGTTLTSDGTTLEIRYMGITLYSNGGNAFTAVGEFGPRFNGNVTKVGTPVNNQIGVWTGDGTIEGTSTFTFDSSTNALNLNGMRLWTDTTTNGKDNIFIGENAGNLSVTGIDNIALGPGAVDSVTTGSNNIGIGHQALADITTGAGNVAIGQWAGLSATANTNIFIGQQAAPNYVSGSGSIFIGALIDAQSTTADGQLSIQNAIFGLGNSATGTAISGGNLGLFATTWGTSAVHVISLGNGTAPSTSITNGIQYYAKDSNSSSELYMRTESGAEVNLSGLFEPVTESGTSFSLGETHRNKIVLCTNSGAITVTVGSGKAAGWNCMLVATNATGTITLSASGTTLNGTTSTAAQFDTLSIVHYGSENYLSKLG
jgi:trimeric autotransporter adhesin